MRGSLRSPSRCCACGPRATTGPPWRRSYLWRRRAWPRCALQPGKASHKPLLFRRQTHRRTRSPLVPPTPRGTCAGGAARRLLVLRRRHCLPAAGGLWRGGPAHRQLQVWLLLHWRLQGSREQGGARALARWTAGPPQHRPRPSPHARPTPSRAPSRPLHRTTLPLKKGLSSSAALCVLVARAFNRAYGLGLTTRGEMQYAYEGERMTPSQVLVLW